MKLDIKFDSLMCLSISMIKSPSIQPTVKRSQISVLDGQLKQATYSTGCQMFVNGEILFFFFK